MPRKPTKHELKIETLDGTYYVTYASKNHVRICWKLIPGASGGVGIHIRVLERALKFMKDPSLSYKRIASHLSMTRTTLTKPDGSTTSVITFVATYTKSGLIAHVPMMQGGPAVDWFEHVVMPTFYEYSRVQNDYKAPTAKTLTQIKKMEDNWGFEE